MPVDISPSTRVDEAELIWCPANDLAIFSMELKNVLMVVADIAGIQGGQTSERVEFGPRKSAKWVEVHSIETLKNPSS